LRPFVWVWVYVCVCVCWFLVRAPARIVRNIIIFSNLYNRHGETYCLARNDRVRVSSVIDVQEQTVGISILYLLPLPNRLHREKQSIWSFAFVSSLFISITRSPILPKRLPRCGVASIWTYRKRVTVVVRFPFIRVNLTV